MVKICYCTGSVLTTLLLRIVHPTLMERQLQQQAQIYTLLFPFCNPDQQFNIVYWVDGCMEPTDHQNLYTQYVMSLHYGRSIQVRMVPTVIKMDDHH